MRNAIAIIGQIIIIAGLLATICLCIREQLKKPRTFYYILINRIRYIGYVGIVPFMRSKLGGKPLEDHPYNYSWKWLSENRIYLAYAAYEIATLDLIYQMISQVSTGYIFIKPAGFYIFSPIRSIALFYMVALLINEVRYWKRKYIETEKKHGDIIDKFNKLPSE